VADRVGQQFGNYRLVTLLGTGGYAQVYLGQHVRLELQAAIKVLHTHLTESEAEHFQQEAQTIARLAHPSIVRILDYDVQDGIPFLVMDYAPNGSLRRRYPKGTVVPLPQIVSSVKQVAAALQYAHERKVIHRDVKPENMLLGRQEEVLLSDFGLAALSHSSGSLSTQEAIGTLAYMAPEQIEGHPRAASDQYALGVVVYEWLCGQRPFEGSATEVMVQQLTMPPPPLHEKVVTIPLDIEQVVLRALAKDAKERFASVREFAQALEQASLLAQAYEVPVLGEQAALVQTEATSYATVATPSAEQTVAPVERTAEAYASPSAINTPPSQSRDLTPEADHLAPLMAMVAPSPNIEPAPMPPTPPVRQRIRRLSGRSAALLVGLVVVVIAAGVLGSLSLLAHFRVPGARSGPSAIPVARGGTWTYAQGPDPGSLIPNGPAASLEMMDALYLPLFSGMPRA
jgi:serine/threonine protein kinase